MDFCLEVCFVSATLDLTEFPETVYRINIHYVDVHITRNVLFHKFSGNSYSDFLSLMGVVTIVMTSLLAVLLNCCTGFPKLYTEFGNHFLRIFALLHLKSYCC